MIIDSKQYSEMCQCGHTHEMETSRCIIEAGCMVRLNGYLKEQGLSGVSVAVYDQNTYRAHGIIHPQVDQELILDPHGLHADENSTAYVLSKLPVDCGYLIAIGSGTVHDIVRFCAYERKIPFVSCPTAASVDGFCSSVAAMTWRGHKKTFPSAAPRLVVADLDVISHAPMFLTRSGFGDMIGKLIALAEWRIAHLLTGEYFCERICKMTHEATQAVIDSADGILDGDEIAYEKLIFGLLMSGLAMQLLGNSRCASGAEHHISHFIEMKPEGLGICSDALHGEKVGVGTLLASRTYHALCAQGERRWGNYQSASEAEILAIFGEKLMPAVLEENANDCGLAVDMRKLSLKWVDICKIIETIPTEQDLLALYWKLGMKSTLSDIGIDEKMTEAILHHSPLIRNRLTLMRLRRALVH